MQNLQVVTSVVGASTVLNCTANGQTKQLVIATALYNALTSLGSTPITNSQAQVHIATACGWPVIKGRCAKAAAALEKYTNGYAGFNGWVALVQGSMVGNARYFTSAPALGAPVAPTAMLTRHNAPNSAKNQGTVTALPVVQAKVG